MDIITCVHSNVIVTIVTIIIIIALRIHTVALLWGRRGPVRSHQSLLPNQRLGGWRGPNTAFLCFRLHVVLLYLDHSARSHGAFESFSKEAFKIFASLIYTTVILCLVFAVVMGNIDSFEKSPRPDTAMPRPACLHEPTLPIARARYYYT